MEDMQLWPDEPPITIQECPLCGGEVEIGLAGMLRVGKGPEHWSESGRCRHCQAALVRELTDTERPVVFMKWSDWRPST
jgi:hypothetical protein